MSHIPLFHAWSDIDNFPTRWGPCDHVRMNWFVQSRVTPVVPYADVIPGYPSDRSRAMAAGECTASDEAAAWAYETGAVDELFTELEVDALRRYLVLLDTTLDIKRAELPLPSNVIGYGAIAVGGATDFYTLDRHKDYSVSVPVWGYYQLDDPQVRFHNGTPAHFEYTLGELLGQ